ncbi:DUF2290 domain-containing protein [Psychrobacter frigidicola]|uniref:DUF2290 domain-containing protein n=1 Tax=Psychrobacter frigidicola TaxID=45611 RepID=UPI00191B1C11|nr:DUF2290 domain-containing protein [Psychrobacter frigidicola]
MSQKNAVLKQIRNITSKLTFYSLSDAFNFPCEKDGNIGISGKPDLSISLKNISYIDTYHSLNRSKSYNLKMIDGALIQMTYSFERDNLIKHRLAFFPSPELSEFQNNYEIYEMDEVYADIIDKNIVTVPIRFDYDPANFEVKEHPMSHLTIGQYKNCRIPVNAPLSPNMFMDFILRNFYNTAHKKYADDLDFDKKSIFDECIDDLECGLLHLFIRNET